MTTKNLLIELFVEELPPKALKKLGEAFADDIFLHLRKLDFIESDSVKTSFASPRRLAIHVTKAREVCPDVAVRTKLVPVQVAYDARGEPSPALIKRLKKEDAKLSEVSRAFEDGKEFVWLDRVAPGQSLSYVLESIILAAISNLPIPKVMTYQLADGWESVQFVRPAHLLVALHGADIIPVSVLGLQAGRTTQGHRFEASSKTLELRNADSYEAQMESEGAVIPSFSKRRAEIVRQLNEAAAKEGLKPIEDEALLDEVTALVERPNVLLCKFDEQFLEVPQECLILTMKANQKYFPLLDANGRLTNKFLVVSNIRPDDASAVIEGNERVVRPRLADAKFFFDQDRKKTLESRVLGLAKVVYHNRLGTQGERVQRVQTIARTIGYQLGGEKLAREADHAALIAKADLLTDMVGEFPELQGIMGRYYAQHDGLSDDIAFAIEDHYKPRFAGDELPRNQVGICVALADKLETLIGLFGIGEKPTGDKDPFALRRHALGIIRILIELNLPLSLAELLNNGLGNWLSAAAVQSVNTLAGVEKNLPIFIWDRLSGLLREQGYSTLEVDAIVSLRPQHLGDIPKRLAAVRSFVTLPEADALAAANKRVGNILKKAEGDFALRQAQGERIAVNESLLQEEPERALYKALGAVAPEADAAFARGDYTNSLQQLAKLKEPVDTFFDKVMVNAEDAALRANRLALLAQLHAAMNRVADISKLAA